MSGPQNFDWKETYLAQAQLARRKAAETSHKKFHSMWLNIASHWEALASLQTERCACGNPATVVEYAPDGERLAACTLHRGERPD